MKAIGGILGDIAGSIYEHRAKAKTKKIDLFGSGCHFTDDTVLTIALMDYFNQKDKEPSYYYKKWAKKYKDAGFGYMFYQWAINDIKPTYQSYANGLAMIIMSVGYVAKSLKEVDDLVKLAAKPTHSHIEAIKGAKLIAGAIYLARNKKSKKEIYQYALSLYPTIKQYNLEDFHQYYEFDVSSKNSVPVAFYIFLKANNYIDTLKNAMYIGGDTDTIACMAGAIAEAYYDINIDTKKKINEYLPKEMIEVIKLFNQKYLKNS